MNHHSTLLLRWRTVVSCAALLFSCAALAQPVRQSVPAHVPAAARLVQSVTRMGREERLSLAISLPFRNQEALTNLLEQINDPTSPNYHHYLSREQFTEMFGPTEEDYNAVRTFAVVNGFRINAEHANRMLIEVNGTVADVERTFHTTLGIYQHPTEARTFYAPSVEPSVDLAVPVLSVGGLDNFALARPRLRFVSAVEPNAAPNSGSGPGGGYFGGDFRAAYAPNTTLNGSGQIVGLLQFDGYTASDITYYETHAGLPSVTLSNVLLSGASGLPSHGGGEVEVSLDIEAAIAMAPGLAQVMVYMAPNPSPFETILNRMVSDNAAKQLSCSWFIPGGAAHPAADQIFQEMALQGQTFFNASGDDDAYTGLIDFPGDSPYITQVGGTTLTTTGPGGARVSETVWNRGNGTGSGGGISTQYGIPTWQTNISMAANQGSTTMRNVPDVALTGENVYVRVNASDTRVGGTSCSAPLWAGFAALINQKVVANGQPTIGFINDAVDKIGSGSSYASCFFDITTGNNTKSSSPTKFLATMGYDLCTGWGTPNGQNLIDALANLEPLQVTPGAGFNSTGGVGGPFTVTSQNLSLTNAGTNVLNWTLVNNTPWLSASPASGTINTGALPTIVMVSLNTTASNLTVGTYNGALYFSNLDSHASFERDYSLVIINPPSVTTQPTNRSVLDGATATFSASVVGGLPLFYRWRLNGTNVIDGGDFSGAATTILTISNISPADTGIYTLFVTNIAGTTTSSNALLSIMDSQPVILISPSNQTVIAGRTATFSVAALGDKPFYYQWNYGGPGATNINDATNATLTLSNVQLADAGLYSVMVSNFLGTATSSYAMLTVVQVPVITTFSPAAGAIGTNVSIAGYNFNSIASNNIVYFGGVRAKVVSASTTNLTVTMPPGATYAPITVTVNGLTAYASQPFLPIFHGSGQISISSLGPRIDLGTGDGPQRVFISDLDGDGKPDLIVAHAKAGVVSIFQNISTNGSLTADSFGPHIDLFVGLAANGSDPYSITIADLDGDGKLDVITLNADNNLVSIFKNIGASSTITTNSFGARIDLPGGNAMRGVASQDLNGDGKPEIIVGNQNDGNISIYENDSTIGNIEFAPRVNFPSGSGATTIAIGDVNGDGSPDVAVANYFDGTVSIFQNLGFFEIITTNSFAAAVNFTGLVTPFGLAFGDLDGDGKLDMVVGGADGSSEIAIYRNTVSSANISLNSFASPKTFAVPGLVNLVALGDLDGDGKLDIAIVTQGSDALSIFKNISAPGSFTSNSLAPRVDFPTGSNPNGVFIGDLDGDGRPDIVFGNFYDDTVSIFQNLIQLSGVPVIVSQPTNQTITAGSDTLFSVTAVGAAPLFYQWYFNQTNAVFGATNSTLTLTNVQLSDSGLFSVIVSNSIDSATSTNAILTVTPSLTNVPIILSFNPASAIAGTTLTIIGLNFSGITSNNVVYFGAVQAAVTSSSPTNLIVSVPTGATYAPITVTVGGLTAFSRMPFVPIFSGIGPVANSSFAPRVDLNTPSGPLRVMVADLNRDGKPDLIVANSTAGYVSIFQNINTNGSISADSFSLHVDLFVGLPTSGAIPYTLTVADLDGDGRLDIIAINAANNTVSIFRNISSPDAITTNSFATRVDLSGGNAMRGVAVQDLDGDGRPEIITGNQSDGNISIFKNNSTIGNFSFAPRVNFAAGNGATIVAIGDLDGDAKPDIAVANYSSGTISIFRNLFVAGVITNNSFALSVSFAAPATPFGLAFGDMDGDGKLDMVVGGANNSSQLAVYRNIATIGGITANSFATPVIFAAPGWVNFIALSDLNGDGRLDIALVTQSPDAFSVFANISTPGSFTTASLASRVDFPAGSNPSGVAIGDLDGDGRPDVVFNNFYDNTMSIYRNVIPIGQMPVITMQPTNLVASIGGTASFAVTATGTAPLHYQWYFNGSNSIGAGTNSILTLTNVVLTNAGFYSVTVSNQLGSVTSSNATLTVTGLDHFSWNPIPSPRFINSPFAVTVVAQDITNATFTNFTSTVLLSATSGVLISPPVSGNFVSGVWNGYIAVPQLASGLVLKASDGAGHVGLANSFDVVNQPALGTLNFGTSLLVSWPVSPSGFVLESSPDLLSGAWSLAPGSPISFNGQNLQSVPLSGTNQFFRLRFLGP